MPHQRVAAIREQLLQRPAHRVCPLTAGSGALADPAASQANNPSVKAGPLSVDPDGLAAVARRPEFVLRVVLALVLHLRQGEIVTSSPPPLVYCPEAYISPATRTLWAVMTDGRPPWRPRARAAANPALVRSRMRSRSNSAKAAKTWKTSLPPGVVVSIASCRLRNPMSRSARQVTVSTRCRRDRLGRSSSTPPGCHWAAAGPGPARGRGGRCGYR
jgi:hypothetical protein